jgi:hypothetical protein
VHERVHDTYTHTPRLLTLSLFIQVASPREFGGLFVRMVDYARTGLATGARHGTARVTLAGLSGAKIRRASLIDLVRTGDSEPSSPVSPGIDAHSAI